MSALPARHLQLVEVDDETGEVHRVESGALAKLEGELVNLRKLNEQLEATIKDLERDMRSKRRQIALLERDKVEERLAHPDRLFIVRVATYWHAKCRPADFNGRKRLNPLSPDRFDALAALAEMQEMAVVDGKRRKVWKYPAEAFKAAIDGAAFDPFTTPLRNGKVKTHNDLEQIMRSVAKFEAFVEKSPNVAGTYEGGDLEIPRVPGFERLSPAQVRRGEGRRQPLEFSGEKEDPSWRFQATADRGGRHEYSEVSHEHHGFRLVGQGRGLVARPEAPWRGLVRRGLAVGVEAQHA